MTAAPQTRMPLSPTRMLLPGRPKPYVMAHRGNRVTLPENTLVAFERGLQDGADVIETDLHLSRDNVLVCIHDPTVDRTTDGRGPVAQMSLQELKQLNAAARYPDVPAQQVLTLAELASIIPTDVALALELKTDRFLEESVCQQLVRELDAAGIRARTVTLSFSLPRLQAVTRVSPDIPMGWISLFRFWPLAQVQLSGPLWPALLINPFYVWIAHHQGQLVAPLDPTPDSRLWLYCALGCDAVLSDDARATIAALRRKGYRP